MTVRIVVFQEGEWLSAQCLEYDLATQARTLGDLWYEIQRLLAGHAATRVREGKEPFADVRPAPRKYWRMFERSKIPLPLPRLPFRLGVPKPKLVRPEVRVAA